MLSMLGPRKEGPGDSLAALLAALGVPAAGEAPGDVALVFERWRRSDDGEHHGLRYKLKAELFAKESQEKKLTDAIRRGVPPELRGKVWFLCSGGLTKRRRDESSYEDFLKEGQLSRGTSEASKIIAADLPRTGCDKELLPALENILLAYSVRNPTVGYTQSMNFVVAALLQYCGEEEVFWMLCSLIEDLVPEGYYSEGLGGVRADLQVLDSIVQRYLPKLHQHFAKNYIDLTPIWVNWFLCLFANTLPSEHSQRLLDIVLHEGSKVLFRAALAILQLRQAELLASDNVAEAYTLLRNPFEGSGMDAPDSRELSFASVSAEDFVRHLHGSWLRGLRLEHVRRTRDACYSQVKADDAKRAAQKEEYRRRREAEQQEMQQEDEDDEVEEDRTPQDEAVMAEGPPPAEPCRSRTATESAVSGRSQAMFPGAVASGPWTAAATCGGYPSYGQAALASQAGPLVRPLLRISTMPAVPVAAAPAQRLAPARATAPAMWLPGTSAALPTPALSRSHTHVAPMLHRAGTLQPGYGRCHVPATLAAGGAQLASVSVARR